MDRRKFNITKNVLESRLKFIGHNTFNKETMQASFFIPRSFHYNINMLDNLSDLSFVGDGYITEFKNLRKNS